MSVQIYSLKDLDLVAYELIKTVSSCGIIIFTGSLGAGKTTLIRALLRAQGVTDVITSPTFSYMNIYKGKDNVRFIHFDLYRLDNFDQFIAAGFDEYLQLPEATVFIEWPEIIADLLDKIPHCHVHIDYLGDTRKLIVEKHAK